MKFYGSSLQKKVIYKANLWKFHLSGCTLWTRYIIVGSILHKSWLIEFLIDKAYARLLLRSFVAWKCNYQKNFALKSLAIHKQLWSFLPLCKIFCHYKSLSHTKSMPQKSNHDFKEKYPYVRPSTLVRMRSTDILTKDSCFLA